MRFKTKIGAVLTATAIATVGLAGQAGAWQYSMDIQSTIIVETSICAAVGSTAGSVALTGTSTYLKISAPAGFGLGSTAPVTESLFADSALSVKITDVVVQQTVTGENATYWLMTGTGSAALPATVAAGSTAYVGEFTGGPKSPLALTVNKPAYGCQTVPADDGDDDHEDNDHDHGKGHHGKGHGKDKGKGHDNGKGRGHKRDHGR
jgi:hypothetical protein